MARGVSAKMPVAVRDTWRQHGLSCAAWLITVFGQLHRLQLGMSDPAPIPSAWVAVIKGVGLALGVIALVVSLRRLPEISVE
jgi:hypothetical protein